MRALLVQCVSVKLMQAHASQLAQEQTQNQLGWQATGRRLFKHPDRLYNAAYMLCNIQSS